MWASPPTWAVAHVYQNVCHVFKTFRRTSIVDPKGSSANVVGLREIEAETKNHTLAHQSTVGTRAGRKPPNPIYYCVGHSFDKSYTGRYSALSAPLLTPLSSLLTQSPSEEAPEHSRTSCAIATPAWMDLFQSGALKTCCTRTPSMRCPHDTLSLHTLGSGAAPCLLLLRRGHGACHAAVEFPTRPPLTRTAHACVQNVGGLRKSTERGRAGVAVQGPSNHATATKSRGWPGNQAGKCSNLHKNAHSTLERGTRSMAGL